MCGSRRRADGIDCAPCPGEPDAAYWVPFRAENIEAPRLDGVTMSPRSEADILADPTCG